MSIERIPIHDREMWLESRLRYLGASELPIVCGEAGYGSLAELYAQKKGLQPPLENNAVLDRGRWGEAAVFQALQDKRPHWKITRANVHVVDTERRIACTPDGYAQAPEHLGIGLIQAKVISRTVFRERWLEDPADDVEFGDATPPAMYRIQTIVERMLNADRCQWCALVVIITTEWDWRFRLFDIEPDAQLESEVIRKAEEFFRNHLDPGIMPPFEPLRDAALIKALYPHDDGTEIDLRGDNRALVAVEDLIQTSAECKALAAREKALKAELTAKLGEHSYARLADGRRLSWKLQHRKGYSVDPSSYRVLRILKE